MMEDLYCLLRQSCGKNLFRENCAQVQSDETTPQPKYLHSWNEKLLQKKQTNEIPTISG